MRCRLDAAPARPTGWGAGALLRAVTMYNHAGPPTIPDRAHPLTGPTKSTDQAACPGRSLTAARRPRAGLRGATMHNDPAHRIIPRRPEPQPG
ncbi:hypothetical protein EDC02_0006 [Micromonospora sp. Llam0]|nr:hypothetical protein EDC02_0006 [Micromonospora sp. Llam0]